MKKKEKMKDIVYLFGYVLVCYAIDHLNLVNTTNELFSVII